MFDAPSTDLFPMSHRAAHALVTVIVALLATTACRDSTGDPFAPAARTSAEPRNVTAALPSGVTQIAPGAGFTCALDVSRLAWCWGHNDWGSLGIGRSGPMELFPVQHTPQREYRHLSSGGFFACALDPADTTWCWGMNGNGQLADGTTSNRNVPAPAAVPPFTEIDAGYTHACGVLPSRQILCWGDNSDGQLGDGTAGAVASAPVAVASAEPLSRVSAGYSFTCALADSGEARCWGINDHGQLGNGSTANAPVPTPVAFGIKFIQISTGNGHTCALNEYRKVMCWGRNDFGQVGIGALVPSSSVPRQPFIPELVQSISAGFHHSCALGDSGTVYCWGLNLSGQIGDGTNVTRVEPVAVAPGRPFMSLVAGGGSQTCGISWTAAVCWGSNWLGALGDGTRADSWWP